MLSYAYFFNYFVNVSRYPSAIMSGLNIDTKKKKKKRKEKKRKRKKIFTSGPSTIVRNDSLNIRRLQI